MKQLWIAVLIVGGALGFAPHSQRRDTGKALLEQGRAYLKEGEWEKALRELDRAIAVAPKLAAAWYSRGVVKFLTSQ